MNSRSLAETPRQGTAADQQNLSRNPYLTALECLDRFQCAEPGTARRNSTQNRYVETKLVVAGAGRNGCQPESRDLRSNAAVLGVGDGRKKLPRGNNFCACPLVREVPLVSGHQIVSGGGFGAFEENVVVGIAGGGHRYGGRDRQTSFPDFG